jgi:NADPH:quinone reductase-like Zn-dependent oxidoreductase
MKAVRVNEWGKPVQLEDIPQPKAADDEALVCVHAASINPFDAAVHAGYMAGMAKNPLTLGADYSGEVVEVGKNINGLKPGDAVFGLVVLRAGTFSEYTTPKANEIARKPKSLDHVHASAVPLPAMAAWISLFDKAQFKGGERILIHGVSGAVGGLTAQLAKTKGAYVYGTDIPEKAQHAQKLGVDRFIDVTNERFEDVVKDVDVVLDYVGGETMGRSYDVLKSGGRYVTTLMMEPPQDEPVKRGIQSMGVGAFPRADVLAQVADLIDVGKLNIFVNRTFPLKDAQMAMDFRLTTKAPGKVVLTVL